MLTINGSYKRDKDINVHATFKFATEVLKAKLNIVYQEPLLFIRLLKLVYEFVNISMLKLVYFTSFYFIIPQVEF